MSNKITAPLTEAEEKELDLLRSEGTIDDVEIAGEVINQALRDVALGVIWRNMEIMPYQQPHYIRIAVSDYTAALNFLRGCGNTFGATEEFPIDGFDMWCKAAGIRPKIVYWMLEMVLDGRMVWGKTPDNAIHRWRLLDKN